MPNTVTEGQLLWQPTEEQQKHCRLSEYLGYLARSRGRHFAEYAEAYAWSVTDLSDFWSSIAEFFRVSFHAPGEPGPSAGLPKAHWFEGATLNYAEHALRDAGDAGDGDALIALTERGERRVWTRAELARDVARARAGLRRLGVTRGDRVAALLANTGEAVVAFLATVSLGAVWSSCAPEFGVSSVLDRFQQIEPKVLLAVTRYEYGGKSFDRSAELASIVLGLPSLLCTVCVGTVAEGLHDAIGYQDLLAEYEPLAFEGVPFEHPIWVLYSSGTTGLPKPIVHGHGGILLEHLKALALHLDLGEKDRFFWFSTTGWMMWNMLVSGLLLRATVVLYDGSPAYPDLYALWRLAEREQLTYFGTSAPYLLACQKAGLEPGQQHDLSLLRGLGTTGAPLPADGFAWVYRHVSRDLLLGSISGGTDVCTAFLLSCPLLPVRAGEIQCRGLGAKIEAFDEAGRSLVGAVGELVLTAPFPAMPLYFWGDAGGLRFNDSYFSMFPGVWRHGDWLKLTASGAAVIYGRSDSTLNRGGVRMGTSEFYRVVERATEIADSLVVDTGSLDDDAGLLYLFVVLVPGANLDEALKSRLAGAIRRELSPRHVPDQIIHVQAIPRTLNGKKLEVPVKRLFLGAAPESVASRDTLSNPEALDDFARLAASSRAAVSVP